MAILTFLALFNAYFEILSTQQKYQVIWFSSTDVFVEIGEWN